MKHLNYYKNKNLISVDDVFNYFFKTIIPENRTWDYFVNWEKVFGGIEKYDEGYRWRENLKSGTLCTNSGGASISGIQLIKEVQYVCVASRGRNIDEENTEQQLESRSDGKTNSLTKVQKDNMVMSRGFRIRRLTPLEYERLQTVPDDYTNHVSNTQRYKMLGNGWTIDVIVHILSFAKF